MPDVCPNLVYSIMQTSIRGDTKYTNTTIKLTNSICSSLEAGRADSALDRSSASRGRLEPFLVAKSLPHSSLVMSLSLPSDRVLMADSLEEGTLVSDERLLRA